jgi:DNA replication and repair protein RecF
MYCSKLTLINYRNYHRLELELPRSVSIFHGRNAQGKSNLLEAILLLATTRGYRATTDRELIHWDTPPPRFARVEGTVQRRRGTVHVEIVILEQSDLGPAAASGDRPVQKRLKVNGIPRRAIDVVGQVNVVLFSPEDLELVAGAPAVRRRYLDIMLCQIDPHYCRALQQYNHVVMQRNALLRQLGGRASAGSGRRMAAAAGAPSAGMTQLQYWDQQLVTYGTQVLQARVQALVELSAEAAEAHARLLEPDPAGGEPRHPLRLTYRPSLEAPVELCGPAEEVRRAYAEHLERIKVRELQQGVTLVGPHRDDVSISLGGIDMHTYGSRGQHRMITLAIKLAELRLMERRTGEQPILLLDDVASELDPQRRAFLLRAIEQHEQVLLTTSDLGLLDPAFVQRHPRFEVCAGNVTPAPDPLS